MPPSSESPAKPSPPSGKKPVAKPKKTKGDTPAMRQFHRFKEQHPGCVLFFRMGDFYEMFFDDAKLAHRVLGVTLTQRTEGVPMAGVPYHSVEGYLRRMIQAGHRVAVCEQVGDAADAKAAGTVVKRDVTRVITPGTLTDESLLADEQVNPCAAVVFHNDDTASLAWAELSTGDFQLATFAADQVADELARINPSELLFCETADGSTPPRIAALADGVATTGRPGWQFRTTEALDALRKQYQVAQLAGFGLNDADPALGAAGGLLHYLLETQRTTDTGRLPHLRPPKTFARTEHLVIDQTTLASLEVEKTLRGNDDAGSLLGVLRRGGSEGGCVTAMGKRRLRDWLCYPLADRDAIERRQSVVQALVDDSRFARELAEALDGVHDVPRITARLAVGRATPRDLVALGRSTQRAQLLEQGLADRPTVKDLHERVAALLPVLNALAERIDTACIESPPAHLREGGLFRDGHDAQLDEQRSLQRDSNTWLAGYQKQLAEQTDVPSLKVGYNKVFGYYIEVTAANKAKIQEFLDTHEAGAGWMRKQTLKNAERYITPPLKEFEGKVLGAESRAIAREQALFAELCAACEKQIATLHAYADAAADLDVLLCFGRRAARHRYVRPTLVDEPALHLVAARHPVLDELLGDRFVPNDVALGVTRVEGRGTSAEQADSSLVPRPSSLALLTGPNMAGKSTYIRTAALLALLAHTGSFVPADAATVGLCDRIFTRVGANDELHAGRSTFMVEMTETANICHHATDRSLVILDEIGRGTSTLDGLSLAWAIAEHLSGVGCRCLFATHYHELITLAERHDNVTNLHVTVREWNDDIVFLHRVQPGSTDRSYGIHVAKIAGLPPAVVDRANQLLQQLAVQHDSTPGNTPGPFKPRAKRSEAPDRSPAPQLSLFTEYMHHPAIDQLRALDLNTLTPMQAFDTLRHLVEQTQTTSSPPDTDDDPAAAV